MTKYITKESVLSMATNKNPVINISGNKIEFRDGTIYEKDFQTSLYKEVKNYMLIETKGGKA